MPIYRMNKLQYIYTMLYNSMTEQTTTCNKKYELHRHNFKSKKPDTPFI